jgi:hypothetical protein
VVRQLEEDKVPERTEETIDLTKLGTEWDGVVKDLEAQKATPGTNEETIDLTDLGPEWDDVVRQRYLEEDNGFQKERKKR